MPTETLSQRITLLEPAFTVFKPAGAGPFPTAIFMHGCGGPQSFLEKYAEAAQAAGAASIIVDSYKPRGINKYQAYATICTGLQMWGRWRAGDLFAAVAWARAQDWVQRDCLLAAGWSHGGWTLIDAMALRSGAEMVRATELTDLPDEPLEGVRACFLAYPYAGRASFAGRRAWRFAPPSVAIIGGRDTIVGAETPHAAMHRLNEAGAAIDIHVFKTATHAFDSHEAIDVRVRYDPEHTANALALMTDLVSRISAPNSPAR